MTHFYEGWHDLHAQEQDYQRQARQRRRNLLLGLAIGLLVIALLVAVSLAFPMSAGGQGRAVGIALSPCHPCVACSMHEDCGMGHCRDGRCVCGNFRWCTYLPLVMRSYPMPVPDPPQAIDPRVYGLGIQVIRGCNPVGTIYFRLVGIRLLTAAEGGGNRMVRFSVLDPNGQPVALKVACLSSAWDRGCVVTNAETDPDLWAGVPMKIGYVPAYGPGPYAGSICGLSDFIIGMGLPDGEDVSFFLTFQIEGAAE